MTSKYHINSNGETGACSAQPGSCPFGENSEHYASKELARGAFEATMSSEPFSKPLRKIMGVTVPERFYHITTRSNYDSIRASGIQLRIGEGRPLWESLSREFIFSTVKNPWKTL